MVRMPVARAPLFSAAPVVPTLTSCFRLSGHRLASRATAGLCRPHGSCEAPHQPRRRPHGPLAGGAFPRPQLRRQRLTPEPGPPPPAASRLPFPTSTPRGSPRWTRRPTPPCATCSARRCSFSRVRRTPLRCQPWAATSRREKAESGGVLGKRGRRLRAGPRRISLGACGRPALLWARAHNADVKFLCFFSGCRPEG